MGYRNIKKLPTADQLIEKLPLAANTELMIKKHRQELEDILSGKDQRKILIIGPCSAWPYAAAIEYAERLFKVQEQVKDKLKLVMRTYIQKPRTVKGWTGPLNQ